MARLLQPPASYDVNGFARDFNRFVRVVAQADRLHLFWAYMDYSKEQNH
jgi:hypothetical protein